MMVLCLLSAVIVMSTCISAITDDVSKDVNSGWFPFPKKNIMAYTTTQYVTDWGLVEGCWPLLGYEMWMGNILSLGFDGPLGPFGPLGIVMIVFFTLQN